MPRLLLDDELGPVLDLRSGGGKSTEARSVVYRLAALRDKDKADAEARRLLYVAATRAADKLLVSGHLTLGGGKKDPGRLILKGWLKELGGVLGLDEVRFESMPERAMPLELPALGGCPVGCTISPLSLPEEPREKEQVPRSSAAHAGSKRRPSPVDDGAPAPPDVPAGEVAFPPPLVEPVFAPPLVTPDEKQRARDADPPRRAWRVVPTARSPDGPALVVGALVHEALRRWYFPGEGGFDDFLRLHALEEGLTDEVEIEATLRAAHRLLERFREHEFYAELAGAERYHEVPYSRRSGERTQTGVIDLLYRRDGRWHVVDFKIDRIQDEGELQAKVEQHAAQVRKYAAAVEALLGERPVARLCFLDALGEVRLAPIR